MLNGGNAPENAGIAARMAPAVRVELPSGGWWDIRARMTYGVRRRIQEAAAPYVTAAGVSLDDLVADAASALRLMAADAAIRLGNEINDIKLLGSTIAWSFPAPLAGAGLADVDEADVRAVLARMDELYEPASDTGRALQKKG